MLINEKFHVCQLRKQFKRFAPAIGICIGSTEKKKTKNKLTIGGFSLWLHEIIYACSKQLGQ